MVTLKTKKKINKFTADRSNQASTWLSHFEAFTNETQLETFKDWVSTFQKQISRSNTTVSMLLTNYKY